MRQIENILLAGIMVNLVWVEGTHDCFGVWGLTDRIYFNLVKQNIYREIKCIYVLVC